MGLRKKAQKYLEMLISDRLARLEEIYEGQTLTREELLEIKNLIARKVFQVERENKKKVELLEKILTYGKLFQNFDKKSKLLDVLFKELSESFGVKKALFFEMENEKSKIIKTLGLDEKIIDSEIEWSVQENYCLNRGVAECFENTLSLHNIVPEAESYLLVPLKIKNNVIGGLIIFLVENLKCFDNKESEQIFEWIATQFAYPYYYAGN